MLSGRNEDFCYISVYLLIRDNRKGVFIFWCELIIGVIVFVFFWFFLWGFYLKYFFSSGLSVDEFKVLLFLFRKG